MYRYSATQWIFGGEDIEDSLKRLSKYGYDGVELAGEPYSLDMERIKSLLDQYNLTCTSLCGIYTPERDLSSSNQTIREKAVQYVKDCVDMAQELGASHLIVVPTFVEKVSPQTTREEEWANAVKSVREAGEYALSKDINLAVEALNRYESYLVNNLDLAIKFVEEVKIECVKMMADVFHMSIEERSMSDAIKKIARYLIHVHIADNTREAAGLGQVNFLEVIDTLREVNYKGPITMEFLPPISNPYLVSDYGGKSELYDFYTEQSIKHIKSLVRMNQTI
ncbi:sugar phosphate isomerase/epimerase family protein [Metabacillus sp. RGM 3146]|uniref:sugar phosphate isomerase/epimerase family protein n=1 Tax=Metabacillus sp. RGM 3146 TaxID=3401092 RepID=UPI003B9A23BB